MGARVFVVSSVLVSVLGLTVSCAAEHAVSAPSHVAFVRTALDQPRPGPIPWPVMPRYADELARGLGGVFERRPTSLPIQQRARAFAEEAGRESFDYESAKTGMKLACAVHQGLPDYELQTYPDLTVRWKAQRLVNSWRYQETTSVDAKEAVDALCEVV